MATNVVLAGGYSAETQAVLSRLGSSQVPSTTAMRWDRAIRDMKASGIFYLLDWFVCYAAENSTAARQNFIANRYNHTAVNSITFVANRYYSGDTISMYLDTNFNPTTATNPKLTQNNGCFGFYCPQDNINGTTDVDIGQTTGTVVLQINLRSTVANVSRFRMPNSASNNVGANSNTRGLFHYNRSSSTSISLYQDGVISGSPTTDTTTAYTNANVTILGSPAASLYSVRRCALAYQGSALTAPQIVEMNRICRYLLGPIGAL